MAQQLGDAAPPVQRLVQASALCFSEEPAPTGQYTVSVACTVARSVEFWSGGSALAMSQKIHEAGDTTTRFAVAELSTLQSAAACRDTVRGMLASLPQLRWIRLSEDEWDTVLPGNILPWIVNAASRGEGFTFFFSMKVHRRVLVDERGMLMACKEFLPSTAPDEKTDCSICFDELEQSAVELPGCGHPFHRECISKWFSREVTCPVCRDDVFLPALPMLCELSSTPEPAQGAVPDVQ